jgi:hypothetical protein
MHQELIAVVESDLVFSLLVGHPENDFEVLGDFHERVDSLGRVHTLQVVLVVHEYRLFVVEILDSEIKVHLNGNEN